MICCCSLAGTKACQTCSNNPEATGIRTNTVVATNRVLISGVRTNADRIRNMTDEELVDEYIRIYNQLNKYTDSWAWLRGWLKQEVADG